jgi:hypothetical protein
MLFVGPHVVDCMRSCLPSLALWMALPCDALLAALWRWLVAALPFLLESSSLPDLYLALLDTVLDTGPRLARTNTISSEPIVPPSVASPPFPAPTARFFHCAAGLAWRRRRL